MHHEQAACRIRRIRIKKEGKKKYYSLYGIVSQHANELKRIIFVTDSDGFNYISLLLQYTI